MYNRKGCTYYIVAVNGRTSKCPFPHPSLRAAQDEAERLVILQPNNVVYVYAAYFKISMSKNGTVKTYLRYKKPAKKEAPVLQ
jgi:hypothetical protein